MTNEITVTSPAALTAQIPASQNPAAVYIASLTSASSRRTMKTALETIATILTGGKIQAADLQWAALRYEHTNAIRARLAESYKPATANKILAALRGVLKSAFNLGQIPQEEYAKAISFKPVKGETALAGRDLDTGEIMALITACQKDLKPTGYRDTAIIGVLYSCGLRRAELVGLDLSDYDPASGKLTIRSGKGRKDRTAYVTNGAKAALDYWLKARGDKAGPLFPVIGRGLNKDAGHRMTTQSVYKLLKFRAAQAGVKDFSPHDFRRTFVSELLDRGADIATVSKLAGHANVTTTARYDRRNEESKQKAAQLLHFPYKATGVPAPAPTTKGKKPAQKNQLPAPDSRSGEAKKPKQQKPPALTDSELALLGRFASAPYNSLSYPLSGKIYRAERTTLESLEARGLIKHIHTNTHREKSYQLTPEGVNKYRKARLKG